MKNILPLVLFCIASFLSILSCSNVSSFDLEVEFEKVYEDKYSNYPEEGVIQKVITSSSEFDGEWRELKSGTTPLPDAPQVNFSQKNVVLLMLDSKPSGGYMIKDVDVVERETTMDVIYTELRPGENCVVTRAITRPFVLISLDKTEKDIRFMPTEPEFHDCESE